MDHTPAPRLPFPPLTRSHILHCSVHHWHPRYRTITPKARLIPLTPAFITYLRSDGILLPPEPRTQDLDFSSTETDSGIYSSPSTPISTFSNNSSSEDEPPDPSLLWPEIHSKIIATIAELGGNVCPKLNWSAPKDATWINATNSMECRSANDVYLLLKSSDFITHDLEQAFDGCVDGPPEKSPKKEADTKDGEDEEEDKEEEMPYTLALRKTIPSLVPSLEFRAFVRTRTLLCICQRDLNYYPFLGGLTGGLTKVIQELFNTHLKDTFEDENFVFDVYIPPPHKRVWLIDVNPWAMRTDPLLFSWLEVLEMEGPAVSNRHAGTESKQGRGEERREGISRENYEPKEELGEEGSKSEESEGGEEIFTPEFRLVGRNDPEAYSFNTPQYSAHKMPKDVVDATGDGEAGLREFMGRWREIVREQENGEREREGADG